MKKREMFFAIVLGLMLAVQGWADKVAVVADGRLARIEYAAPVGPQPPSDGGTSNQPSYAEATFDFHVQELLGDYRGVGFLNVAAELNPYAADGPEWICQNIPVLVSDDLTAPAQGVWFDPHQFDQTGGNHYPGEHDVWPGQVYEVWAMISDTEINNLPGPTGLDQWDHSSLPGGFSVWGLYDTMGGVGQGDDNTPPSTDTAKTAGKIASPVRTDIPDIAQKDSECGPTSTTNSLRWLAKEHDFSNKLPKKDDDLIKNLMKAMTGSDHRPFHGLDGDQLHDGKIKYAKEKELPMIVKGGMSDPKAKGAKAFDYIKSEYDAGEDIEFLIKWPGVASGSHWVTVAGYAVNGNRLFLKVSDPDDGKKEIVTWELDRNGNFKTPRGKMLWAVSESYVKQDDIAVPADDSGAGHHYFSAHTEQQDDGSRTFVQDDTSDVENQYDPATHKIHLKNDQNNNEVKIIKMTARFYVPLDNDRNHPRFNPRSPGKWADVDTTSQIVQRNKHYSVAGAAGEILEIEQKWKLVPNPSSEDLDLSRFFVGTHPLELLSVDVGTWCMKAKVNVEETDKESKVSQDGALSDAIDVKLTQPPLSGATVQVAAEPSPDGHLVILGPGPLVFDDSNWDIPQRIEFGAISDPNDSSANCQTELLGLSLTSTDPAFQDNYLPPVQVQILNSANDPPCPPDCPDPNCCCCNEL